MYLYTLELASDKFYVGTTTNPDARLASHFGGNGAAWTATYPPVRVSLEYPIRKLDCGGEMSRLQEDAQVKAVMLDKGIDSVRGGSYSKIKLSKATVNLLSRELFHATNGCLRCGSKGHWARHCRATADDVAKRIASGAKGRGVKASSGGGKGTGIRKRERRRYGGKGRRGKGSGGGKGTRRVSVRAGWCGHCTRCGRAGHEKSQCEATHAADGAVLPEDDSEEGSDDDSDEGSDDDA